MMLAMSVTFAFSEKFFEELRRLRRQFSPCNQIRPTHKSARDRLLQPPALDISVVSTLQYGRHRPAFELHWPRVMRPVEQTFVEGLFDRGAFVPEHTRDQTRHRIDDHERGKLTPGQHVIAHRHFSIYARFDDPFVESLVSPRHQRHAWQLRKLTRQRLREGHALC